MENAAIARSRKILVYTHVLTEIVMPAEFLSATGVGTLVS